MVALSYLIGWLFSTTGISLMLGCDLSLLSCLSFPAISSPAPSKTLLFLGMTPTFGHTLKEPRGMRISGKGLRDSRTRHLKGYFCICFFMNWISENWEVLVCDRRGTYEQDH